MLKKRRKPSDVFNFGKNRRKNAKSFCSKPKRRNYKVQYEIIKRIIINKMKAQ